MDLSDIRKLVRLMQRGELTELELDDSNAGTRIHLKRSGAGGAGEGNAQPLHSVVQLMPSGSAPAQGMPAAAPLSLPAAEVGPPPGTVAYESPMVGTFYRAPAPDSDPYVEVGTRVEEESTLCIIEAMKVMNEIKSEMKGVIVDILVENGEPVEYGQPLFHIKKG